MQVTIRTQSLCKHHQTTLHLVSLPTSPSITMSLTSLLPTKSRQKFDHHLPQIRTRNPLPFAPLTQKGNILMTSIQKEGLDVETFGEVPKI